MAIAWALSYLRRMKQSFDVGGHEQGLVWRLNQTRLHPSWRTGYSQKEDIVLLCFRPRAQFWGSPPQGDANISGLEGLHAGH